MSIRSWYYKITLDEFSRLEGKLLVYVRRFNTLPPKKREFVERRYRLYEQKHLRFRGVVMAKMFCLFFMYISIISFVTESIPIVSSLTKQASVITGLVGLPVFTGLWLFLGKVGRVMIAESHFLVAEIISTMTTCSRNSKSIKKKL